MVVLIYSKKNTKSSMKNADIINTFTSTLKQSRILKKISITTKDDLQHY